MAVAPLFGFLTSLYFLHWTVLCEVSAQESTEAPFKARCSRTCEAPEEKSAEEKPPLYQCSCSKSCTIYGDCCFDSKYRNTTVLPKTDFICLSLAGHGKYRAVYGCPPDQQSDFCTDGLSNLPPVTSITTNTTYANIFCAMCNGDGDNLVTWNVELRCSPEFDSKIGGAPAGRTRFLTRFGGIWRSNEAGGDGSRSLCKYHAHFGSYNFLRGLELRSCTDVRKISDCSPSWRDLSVIQMCRSYEDPVYFHNTVYRNPHCAECNYLNPEFADCMPFHVKKLLQMGLINSSVSRFCQTRGTSTCIQTLSNMQKGRPYAFSDLLNINEKVCVPPRGKRCCEGQAFDFRTQRCRKTVRA